ncbi:hypothetical protein F2Q70_00016706 [Brassica cretica]|uniref:Uncharacterized protein n=1 Tax=Brassica cretica TaxID=69181 RepID=A0A8S9HZY8_BRACR|nr:hypothetical protein F2Q70_00016706 [Brassica cretica]KAF2596527.1 hypothetical protein F2Q68_00009688 [Brassica cretica]
MQRSGGQLEPFGSTPGSATMIRAFTLSSISLILTKLLTRAAASRAAYVESFPLFSKIDPTPISARNLFFAASKVYGSFFFHTYHQACAHHHLFRAKSLQSSFDTNSTMDMSGDTKFLDTKRQLRSTEDNMTTKLLNP